MQPGLFSLPIGITQGDCLQLMADLPGASVDAVITDPPFAFSGGFSNGRSAGNDDQFFAHWFTDVVRQITRVLKPGGCGFIWSDWRSLPAMVSAFERASERYEPWGISQVLYHDREMIGMGAPFRNQVELILFFRGARYVDRKLIPNTTPNIIRSYWRYGKHQWHDSEKSPAIARKLIEWATLPGEIVLDPFCGSGTVPLACRPDRKCIAYEIDPQIAETAWRRLDTDKWKPGDDTERAPAPPLFGGAL